MVAQVQNVIRVISLVVILMLLGSNFAISATKYFLLEESSPDYRLVKYDLSTKSLYGVDRKVSLYNLLLNEKQSSNALGNDARGTVDNVDLILFSVLPDLKGDTDWVEISMDTIQDALVSSAHLVHLFNENTFSLLNERNKDVTKYFNSYKPIIKKGGQFFVPKNCLLEFYEVCNRPEIFANPYGTKVKAKFDNNVRILVIVKGKIHFKENESL